MKFRVNYAGNVTAESGTFKGDVYAGNIKYGTTEGYFNGGGISSGTIGTGTGSPLNQTALTGIGGGVNFDKMTSQNYTADWVVANHILCYTPGNISGNHYGSWADATGTYSAAWYSKTCVTSVSASFSGTGYYVSVVKADGSGYVNVLTGGSVSVSTGTHSLQYVGKN